MNERIRELARQAGLTDFVLTVTGMDNEVERFAELMVRECANTIKNNQWAKDNQAWSKGMIYSAELIKEHFGVEE